MFMSLFLSLPIISLSFYAHEVIIQTKESGLQKIFAFFKSKDLKLIENWKQWVITSHNLPITGFKNCY